jgi:hypothetical protein
MRLSRRALLAAGAVVAIRPNLAWAETDGGTGPRFLATWRAPGGAYEAGVLDARGVVQESMTLPDRAHGMTCDAAGRRAVVFARRPGTFAVVLDARTAAPLHEISAAPGRHFYGHGTFSADGRLLYAAENDYDGERGVVGVYDAAAGFARIGEMDSHGVGPHEVRLHADRRTLVVANGGILTHPAAPRAKLNVASMAPSVAFLDAADGRLRHKATPPDAWHKLSLRHVDVAPDGLVVAVAQWEGEALEHPPLVATCRLGAPLRFLEAPEMVLARMDNYCGAVAFSADGETIGVTAPRGNLAAVWRRDGRFLGAHELPDTCAIDAAEGRDFFLAGGDGGTADIDGTAMHALTRSQRRFDNHLRRIG